MGNDYAMTTVVVVALACMMLVNIVGELFVVKHGDVVACTVEVAEGHIWVGKGEVF